MPDYTLRLWDRSAVDDSPVAFVREAVEAKKWAFAADYVRLFALYTEGGIYLDSDVRVLRPFDRFLQYGFFTSHEIHPYSFSDADKAKLGQDGRPILPDQYIYGSNVQAAMMGGRKGHPFLKDCLAFYGDQHLVDRDGRLRCDDMIIGPLISKLAEKYGYRYTADEQHLDADMVIFEPEVFVGNSAFLTDASYATHLCNGSWRQTTGIQRLSRHVHRQWPAMSPVVGLFEKVLRRAGRLIPGSSSN